MGTARMAALLVLCGVGRATRRARRHTYLFPDGAAHNIVCEDSPATAKHDCPRAMMVNMRAQVMVAQAEARTAQGAHTTSFAACVAHYQAHNEMASLIAEVDGNAYDGHK